MAVRRLLQHSLIELQLAAQKETLARGAAAVQRPRRRRYQLGEASLGEDPPRTGQVQVPGDPAPHVEPVHGPSGRGAVLPVQQHQLLLGTDRAALQHALQLEEAEREDQPRNLGSGGTFGSSTPHLPDGRILLPQSHDDDAVGLADAALRPGGQGVVGLVEDDAVDVLLLAQPAGQSVLVDAEEDRVSSGRADHLQSQHTCRAPQPPGAV